MHNPCNSIHYYILSSSVDYTIISFTRSSLISLFHFSQVKNLHFMWYKNCPKFHPFVILVHCTVFLNAVFCLTVNHFQFHTSSSRPCIFEHFNKMWKTFPPLPQTLTLSVLKTPMATLLAHFSQSCCNIQFCPPFPNPFSFPSTILMIMYS